MATLTYNPKIGTWWTGTVNINYTTSYNSLTNQTTVTFSECSVAYWGRNKYGSHSDSTITVTAADNTSSSGTASFSTDGATNGGTITFPGTPSPTTITVQHAASAGAKSVTIAGSTTIKVYATSTATSQSTASGSGSVSVTTGTYAPASSVTCSIADIGSAPTIQISRNSSSYTHTLTYTFGSLSGTIATKTTSTTITSWKFPTSFYSQIPNAKSGTGIITCETYSGDTLLGTKTCDFTATTNENLCKPTLSPTVEDSNSIAIGVTGNKNTLIIYFSDAAITTGAAARNSATLVSQKVTCGSKSITTSSGTIEDVESGTFTFTATDSRGYSTTQTVTKDIINYINPTCNLNITNPDANGNLTFTITGNYYNGSFGAKNNTLDVYYKYKTSTGAYCDDIAVTNITLNGNTYTATVNLTGLNYQETYTFQATTSDELHLIESAEKVIKTTPIFNWSENDFVFGVPVSGVNGVKYQYGAGDSISMGNQGGAFAGYISSSTKTLFFTIPLDKPIIASNISISGSIIGRGINGYINGTSYSDSTAINLSGSDTYSVSAVKRNYGCITVTVTFTSAITNATNNTPVVVTPYGDGIIISFSDGGLG